jgi:hypothetical protein
MGPDESSMYYHDMGCRTLNTLTVGGGPHRLIGIHIPTRVLSKFLRGAHACDEYQVL